MRKTNYMLTGLLVFFFILYVYQLSINNSIKNTLQEKSNKIEKIKAPINKLSSYEEQRKDLKKQEQKILDEIKTYQSALRFIRDNVDKKEKQIRCQRAFVVGIEKGNCNIEKIYEKYVP